MEDLQIALKKGQKNEKSIFEAKNMLLTQIKTTQNDFDSKIGVEREVI